MSTKSLPEFPMLPLNNRALSLRKKIYGIATNDADYLVMPRINGTRSFCPFYQVWMSMITRCYCAKHQKSYPAYLGCTVTHEWLFFLNFRAWMIEQDWQGKQLDKDILVLGNKVYSPNNCIFVTQQINKLVINTSGNAAPGVSFDSCSNQYRARVTIYGKSRFLGRFPTEKAAISAYREAKAEIIIRESAKQSEPLQSALLEIAHALHYR